MVLIADVTAQREMEERMHRGERLERIGRLAGGISHDLQRLLDLIRREVEGIIAETTDPLVEFRVNEMRATTARAYTLIHQLQVFGQRQSVPAGDLDLNHSIRLRLPFLRHLAGPSVTIETRLDPNLLPVALQEPQLEQILLNLVVNARDAMPDGGKLEMITLNAPASIPGNAAPQVQLIVSDTGCGMSPEVQARAFEPFFTTKSVGKGSGLGLATVYGVVQQAGGSIQLWSQAGAGTRFEICLPGVAADPAGSPASRRAAANRDADST
jgi:signal transduction histidine kinase